MKSRFWVGAAILFGAASALLAPGCEEETEETLCKPGTEVFCLCRGGQTSGTQTCSEDGSTLGECLTESGSCPTVDPTTTTSSSGICTPTEVIPCSCDDGTNGSKTCNDDGESFTDCTTPDGPCGGTVTGDLLLYAACTEAAQCATGVCASGYCTRSCAAYTDCVDEPNELYGECLELGESTQCAPYCIHQDDCLIYGAPSSCGGTTSVDLPEGYFFAACADWGENQVGMLPGAECDYEANTVTYMGEAIQMECDLGGPLGMVCTFGACSAGCYEDADCPGQIPGDCSSDGNVIGCCESSGECQ